MASEGRLGHPDISFNSPLAVSLGAAVIIGILGGFGIPKLFAGHAAFVGAGEVVGTAFRWLAVILATWATARSVLAPLAREKAVSALPFDSELLTDRGTATTPQALEWSMDALKNVEWKRFELLAMEVFQLKGFQAEPTHAGPEEGCDILLRNSAGATAAVAQCKGWNSKDLGVRYVRELLGTMVQFNVGNGVLVAKGAFTPEASALANARNIRLVSGGMLLSFISTLDLAEQERLKGIALTGDYRTPTCPACQEKMVRRKGEAGGADYWGCRHYPSCKSRLFVVNLE